VKSAGAKPSSPPKIVIPVFRFASVNFIHQRLSLDCINDPSVASMYCSKIGDPLKIVESLTRRRYSNRYSNRKDWNNFGDFIPIFGQLE
jgi:hypothetical protein